MTDIGFQNISFKQHMGRSMKGTIETEEEIWTVECRVHNKSCLKYHAQAVFLYFSLLYASEMLKTAHFKA